MNETKLSNEKLPQVFCGLRSYIITQECMVTHKYLCLKIVEGEKEYRLRKCTPEVSVIINGKINMLNRLECSVTTL